MRGIELRSVTKKFGDYIAVNNISMAVEPGLIYGMLGPNGAGKTTTIRMINNILYPDTGEILVDGKKAGPEVKNIIGYLPEERGLYKKLKVLDQIVYFGRLKGLDASLAKRRGQEWLSKMGAADWADKKVQELSKGMAQKVQFICTIIHDPDILILDEPFSGFDPINTDMLKNIIIGMKDQGKTIVLSTHIMQQVEQMCDEICLINKGNIILSGQVRDIKKSFGKDTVLIEYNGNEDFLSSFSGLKFINRTRGRAEFRLPEGINPNDILKKACDSAEVIRFELQEPSLNEIFIDVVSKGGK